MTPAQLNRHGIEKCIFTLLVGAVLVIAMTVAWEWPLRASIIVLVLGIIGVSLTVAQLVSDVRNLISGSKPPEALTMEAPVGESSGRWGALEIWGWIIGFIVLIQLIGFLYAIPVFVLSYAKTYGGGWLLSTLLAIFAGSFVYGIFDGLLHVPWPTPLLHQLVLAFF